MTHKPRPSVPNRFLSPGDVLVVADNLFPCLTKRDRCTLRYNREDGLYIMCENGRHSMDDELSEDGRSFVGFENASIH